MCKSMRITKFGHSCLLVEEGKLRVLMDTGNYNPMPDVYGIDVILITHEHDDHCYLDSIKQVLGNNPQAEIITHEAVGKKLATAEIVSTQIKDGEEIVRNGVSISSHGTQHARLHPDIPVVSNTGYVIAHTLYYAGDSFYDPERAIEVLALPTIGSWMKIEEAIEYAKKLKPKIVFPVHDGILIPQSRMSAQKTFSTTLGPSGIEFKDMVEDSILDY